MEAVEVQSNVYGEKTRGGRESSNEEKRITFRSDGTADAATIQVGDPQRHYTISICPMTARVTLVKGTAEQGISSTYDLDASS